MVCRCIAKQPTNAFNSAPLYYGAMSGMSLNPNLNFTINKADLNDDLTGFDLTACGVATYYLIDRNSSSIMSKFTKKVLQHGMVSLCSCFPCRAKVPTVPLTIYSRPVKRAGSNITRLFTPQSEYRVSKAASVSPFDRSLTLLPPSASMT